VKSPEKQPARNIIKKAVRFSTIPLALVLLTPAIQCGAVIDANIPPCKDDPQPKVKEFTLFPDSASLKIDGLRVKAVRPAGNFNTFTIFGSKINLLDQSSNNATFRNTKNGRNYAILAEPDNNPNNTHKDGTKVFVFSDCETPTTDL
jgi:hypothetical protein